MARNRGRGVSKQLDVQARHSKTPHHYNPCAGRRAPGGPPLLLSAMQSPVDRAGFFEFRNLLDRIGLRATEIQIGPAYITGEPERGRGQACPLFLSTGYAELELCRC